MARQYGHNTDAADKVRKELTAEQQHKDEVHRKIELLFIKFFFGFAAVFLFITVILMYNIHSNIKSTNATLASEQTQLTKLKAEAKAAPVKKVEREVAYSSAKDAGQAVCDAQNAVNKAIAAETAAGASTLSADHQAALVKLRTYIPKDSTNTELSRDSWCIYGNWEFNSSYDFSETKADIVWKCYAPDDATKSRLLAFAKATYDISTNTFSNAAVVRTTWYDPYAKANNDNVSPADDTGKWSNDSESTADTSSTADGSDD